MTSVVRPQSAAPSDTRRYGQLAIAAGVPGLIGPSRAGESKSPAEFAIPLQKATALQEHALKRFTPYAQKASPGWAPPGKEPAVKPTWAMTGAGVVSAGCIDNTYMPRPLTNAWGKARERAIAEVEKLPHKQASDLLLVSKGARLPGPAQGEADMASVRPLYSKTIPLFHGIDPMRVESGFVRSPNIIPGAAPPPQSAMLGVSDMPEVPANHKLMKLAYDQSLNNMARIPVAKITRVQPQRPQSAAPAFLTRPAGLPGGLSLIS